MRQTTTRGDSAHDMAATLLAFAAYTGSMHAYWPEFTDPDLDEEIEDLWRANLGAQEERALSDDRDETSRMFELLGGCEAGGEPPPSSFEVPPELLTLATSCYKEAFWAERRAIAAGLGADVCRR